MAISPAVMGIVNVTPDSFFVDSRTASTEAAVARGREHFALGCDIVDVGGESTRPGASPVAPDEEIARVEPVVRALAAWGPISIDTQKAQVARAAVAAGAQVINDVSCSLVELAGELGVGYVAMHRLHPTITPGERPYYDDVVGDVLAFLRAAATRARVAKVGQLWLDPGIGFNKTRAHNLSLLAHIDQFVALGREYGAGVLVGTSRKRFLGELGRDMLDVEQRLEGSIASEAWSMASGVSMVRVHDARAAVQLRELFARPIGEDAA